MAEFSINLSLANYIIATKFFKNLNICFAISVVEVNQNKKFDYQIQFHVSASKLVKSIGLLAVLVINFHHVSTT